MKKLRRGLATAFIALAFTFGSGSLLQVRADGGPQGQQDTRSGGPSAPEGMTQEEYEGLLWALVAWLLGWA